MKKLLALISVVCLCAACFAACNAVPAESIPEETRPATTTVVTSSVTDASATAAAPTDNGTTNTASDVPGTTTVTTGSTVLTTHPVTTATTDVTVTTTSTSATTTVKPTTTTIKTTTTTKTTTTKTTTTTTTTTTVPTAEWMKDYTSKQIINDNNFQNGFYVRQQDPIVDLGPWRTTDSVKTPAWLLAQWGTFKSYSDKSAYQCLWKNRQDTADNILTNGINYVEYNDRLKSLTLSADTYAFYNGKGHTDNSSWPHLLIEQSIISRQALLNLPEEERIYYSLAADKIILSLDVRMTQFRHTAYSGINACQFSSFYYVVSTQDNGFTWFGAPLFDDRGYRHGEKPYYALDAGSGNYIYGIPQYAVYESTLETGRYDFFNGDRKTPKASGEWMHIELDLKPWLLKLVSMTMGKTTYPNTTDLSQLFFSGLNLGYEIHGSYDVSFEIKNYCLTSYVKK